MKIRHLNSVQVRAVNRIGDILCPANGEMESFSDLGVVEHIDVLLEEIPPADLGDLKMLLTLLGLLPVFALRFVLNLLESRQDMDGEIGTVVRTVRFGLRGIVFSLYYSGLKGAAASALASPVDVIGYGIRMKI